MSRYRITIKMPGPQTEEEVEAQRLADKAARVREAALVAKRAELARSWAPIPKPGNPIIEVDASRWTSYGDFYDGILPCLGAPHWHGTNLNALVESMVWGEINAIEPPYMLRVRGTASLPAFLMKHLSELKEDCTEARIEFNARWDRDVDVDVEILP